MNPTLLLVLTACLFILVFGGLSLLRREGLSVQFALESATVTVVLVGGSWLLGLPLSPVVLLMVLYLVTMRSRLLADVANVLARRKRYVPAFRLYRLALAWWPDATSRLIVLVNRGAAEVHRRHIEAALGTLEDVLKPENLPRLGVRNEAAGRFNLGLAYEEKGEEAKAFEQYNEVVDLLPASVFAQAAKARLQRRKPKGSGG